MDVRSMLRCDSSRGTVLVAAASAVAAAAVLSAPTAGAAPGGTTAADVPPDGPGSGLTTALGARTPALASTPAAAASLAPGHAAGPSRIRVGVRLRPVGVARGRTVPDATRLLPLPSAEVPAAVLLGAVGDTRRAAFLIAEGTTAWGEGTCTSGARGCRTLELAVGQTELLDLPAPAGTVRRYALTVTRIGRVHDATARATRRRERRRSASGLRVVRRAIRAQAPGLGNYRWSAREGVVERSGASPVV